MSHRPGAKISTAIAWRMITEICRRHHKTHKLRVYETHPGEGQYDCLSLYADDGHRQLCDFNRSSNHLHLCVPDSDELLWRDYNNYVQAFMIANDPKEMVDQLEAALGLPSYIGKKLPHSSQPILMMRIVADVLEHMALSRSEVDIRWSIHDSSGMEGTSYKDILFDIEEYRHEADLVGREKVARRCWLLHYHKSTTIIDFHGILRLQSNNYTSWNIWDEYKAGRKVHDLVNQLEQLLAQG